MGLFCALKLSDDRARHATFLVAEEECVTSLKRVCVVGYWCLGSCYGDSTCFEQVMTFICLMTRVFIKQIAD